MEKNDIAIVIPAYRASSIHKTLYSLSAQTDRRFTVYVGDDASPEDLATIVSGFEDRLHIVYYRFPDNYGPEKATEHLKRCLGLIGDESFICILSDDNELTPKCIRRFRRTAASHPDYDVYHWNCDTIDVRSEVTEMGRRFRRKMTVGQMFRRVFIAGAPLSVSSFVFRRDALLNALSGEETLAKATLAALFKAAREKGVLTVRCSRVLLRRHPDSLSDNPATAAESAKAVFSFLLWTEGFFAMEEYPASVKERMRLLAAQAVKMYPAYTADAIRDMYLEARVFDGGLRKMRGRSVLKDYLSRRTVELDSKQSS